MKRPQKMSALNGLPLFKSENAQLVHNPSHLSLKVRTSSTSRRAACLSCAMMSYISAGRGRPTRGTRPKRVNDDEAHGNGDQRRLPVSCSTLGSSSISRSSSQGEPSLVGFNALLSALPVLQRCCHPTAAVSGCFLRGRADEQGGGPLVGDPVLLQTVC